MSNKNKIFLAKLIYTLWDLSGLRFIFRKIVPLNNEEELKPKYRKPSTFFLWVIGIYIATFGIASQRYENKLDIAENKINILMVQLSTDFYKEGLASIPNIQKTKCPYKPIFLYPNTVLKSIFFEETKCSDILNTTKQIVKTWRGKLENSDLDYVDLSHTNLSYANFQRTLLSYTNLSDSLLLQANLIKSIIKNGSFNKSHLAGSDFTLGYLVECDFSDAFLEFVDFSGAYLHNANFKDAVLTSTVFIESDLTNAKNLTFEQLSKTASLYRVKGLDKTLLENLKKHHPNLFVKPNLDKYNDFR